MPANHSREVSFSQCDVFRLIAVRPSNDLDAPRVSHSVFNAWFARFGDDRISKAHLLRVAFAAYHAAQAVEVRRWIDFAAVGFDNGVR